MNGTSSSVLNNQLKESYCLLRLGILCSLVVFIFSFLYPSNKWDLLGHLGSSISFSINNINEIHKVTYGLVEDTIEPAAFENLTKGNDVRQIWAQDPTAFSQTFNFYQPRVLLTYPTSLVFEAGFNPVIYMQLQSSIAAALGLVILSSAFISRSNSFLIVSLPILLLISGVLDVARFEGADALSFCAYGLTIYLLLKNSLWAYLVIAILPLTRSDMILYSLPILTYLFLTDPKRRLLVCFTTIASAASYFSVNIIFDNYGWQKQFYVAQIKYLSHPADIETSITLHQYITALIKGSSKLIYNYQFHAFSLGIMIATAYFTSLIHVKGLVNTLEDRFIVLALIAGTYVIIHFLAFPSMHTRYFAAQYLHILIVATVIIHQWYTLASKKTR